MESEIAFQKCKYAFQNGNALFFIYGQGEDTLSFLSGGGCEIPNLTVFGDVKFKLSFSIEVLMGWKGQNARSFPKNANFHF